MVKANNKQQQQSKPAARGKSAPVKGSGHGKQETSSAQRKQQKTKSIFSPVHSSESEEPSSPTKLAPMKSSSARNVAQSKQAQARSKTKEPAPSREAKHSSTASSNTASSASSGKN